MDFVSLDVDSGKRPGRTEILTGSAADAAAFVDSGHVGRLIVVGIAGNHLDSSNRTVTGTVTALNTVAQGNAVLFNPNGMSNLGRCLILMAQGLDGSSWADLRTAIAFRPAVTYLVAHRGQHQVHEVGGRTQHLVGAL